MVFLSIKQDAILNRKDVHVLEKAMGESCTVHCISLEESVYTMSSQHFHKGDENLIIQPLNVV